MAGLETLIPGLASAEAEYRETQLEAFLGVEPLICDVVALRPFTPRMQIELSAAGNLCVVGNEAPKYSDVLLFLWRCSEGFERNARAKRTTFFQACSILPYVKAVGEIDAYLRRSWSGQPVWSTGGAKSAGIWPSMIVHVMASNYGWTESEILNTPFRRLWQYMHRTFEDQIPGYRHRCTAAMAIRAEWLKQLNLRN